VSSTVDPLAEQLEMHRVWAVLAIAAGILLLTLLTIVAAVGIATATARYSPLPDRLHQAVVGLPVVLLVYEGARRLTGVPSAWLLADRPSWHSFAWAGIGLILPTLVLALQLWLIGATRVGPLPTIDAIPPAVISSLAGGLFAGTLEELSFRGALLRLFEARWGPRVAIGGTAILFASLHQGHAAGLAELILVIASMLAAGGLLAVVVLRTRSVWNAVLLHAGWNTVFGGSIVVAAPFHPPIEQALLQYQLPAGPIWVTGGGATLGATPLTTACLVLAGLIVAKGPDRWPPAPSVPSSLRSGEER